MSKTFKDRIKREKWESIKRDDAYEKLKKHWKETEIYRREKAQERRG